jgi:cysteine desulfurase/selenocysteine lyase
MENNPWTKDFPQLKNDRVYLDSAATSLKPKSVIDKVDYYYNELSANIHRGMYRESMEATDLYEETRNTVANFINALPEEIVFTRGTTASLNLVAFSYGFDNLEPGDEIIVSELEHSSSFLPWQMVAKRTGANLVYVDLDDTGRITVEEFKKVLSDKTRIVALTYASNVLGYVTPIAEIIELAHQNDAVVVVDAAQAIQHYKIDVKKLDADFLAFSGHKMLGPTGVGVLYGKKKFLEEMEPTEFGGDMSDEVNKDVSYWKESPHKFEGGTMPIASVLGLKEAVDYLEEKGLVNIDAFTKKLHKYALDLLSDLDGVVIYNKNADIGIIAFNLEGVPSHDAVSYFAERNVDLRAGQHCAKLIHDWLGIYSSLRASIYLYNTYEDIDRFIQVTKEAVAYFKQLGF